MTTSSPIWWRFRTKFKKDFRRRRGWKPPPSGTEAVWLNPPCYFPPARNACVAAGGLDIVLEPLERMTAEKAQREVVVVVSPLTPSTSPPPHLPLKSIRVSTFHCFSRAPFSFPPFISLPSCRWSCSSSLRTAAGPELDDGERG